MSSIHIGLCATDLRLRRSQRALLRGRVPVRLGLVWFGSCVELHPPPCHPLYSTLSPRALRPKRANGRGVHQGQPRVN